MKFRMVNDLMPQLHKEKIWTKQPSNFKSATFVVCLYPLQSILFPSVQSLTRRHFKFEA